MDKKDLKNFQFDPDDSINNVFGKTISCLENNFSSKVIVDQSASSLMCVKYSSKGSRRERVIVNVNRKFNKTKLWF